MSSRAATEDGAGRGPPASLSPAGPGCGPAVTWRSLTGGTLAAAGVSALLPYNDFIVQNTFLAGSYLPVGLVLLLFVLVVGVNAPLHRWRRGAALSAGELAVIAAMTAVSLVPSQALMRVTLPTMVMPFHLGALDPRFWQTFQALGLPLWLFPVESLADGRGDRVVTGFYGRLLDGETIPYARWVVPILGWGSFIAGLFASLIGLAVILRYQWAENERLPFPLADVQASLIESPAPGRALNPLFRSAAFWVGLAFAFFIVQFNPLNRYFPKGVPRVPLGFSLANILAEVPWVYLSDQAKSASVYFVYLGVAFFIRSRVAFSLWVFFLLKEAATVYARVFQADITPQAWDDQHFGATVAMAVAILWIGRAHWRAVLRDMLPRAGASRGATPPPRAAPAGAYVRFGAAGWLVVAGIAVMIAWLLVVGVGTPMAMLIVVLLLMMYIVTARVVAQTGMAAFRTMWMPQQAYMLLPPSAWSGRDIFLAGAWTVNGPLLNRETLLPFLMHGLQTNEDVRRRGLARLSSSAPVRDERRWLVPLMAWALLIGLAVGSWSSLRSFYRHSAPLAPFATGLESAGGMEIYPRGYVVEPLAQHAAGAWRPRSHDPVVHMTIGAAITTALQAASLWFPGWVLSPIGYLVCSTWYIQRAWFSIGLGWLAKVLVVRFGGQPLYERAKPLFVGLIVGEALAAGVWMIVTLFLASNGMHYEQVRLLPE